MDGSLYFNDVIFPSVRCFRLNVERFSAITFCIEYEKHDWLWPRRSGRGGAKISVELNSVNRKQSDIVINLPRELAELEPRVRQTINENISRGRTNATLLSTERQRRAQPRARHRAGPLLPRSDARIAKGAECAR